MSVPERENVQSVQNQTIITAYKDIPYAVLDEDISGTLKTGFFNELGQIKSYYEIFAKGSDFASEGSHADYVPANLRYKKIRNLINREARFMFSRPLDIIINKNRNGNEKEKGQNTIINEFIRKVLEKNHFNSNVMKAAKDCFIGKRICILLNFNEDTGIDVTFLNALEFYYEYSGDDLTKLVAFIIDVDATANQDKRIRKKSYTINEDGYCHITEKVYDGAGMLIETILEDSKTELEKVPAVIIFNDGLVNDMYGESEIEELKEDEEWYSKLANADIDAGRKNMNPVTYTIDMGSNSTENLPTGPGAYWDLQSDENGVEQKTGKVGRLESQMSYSSALSTTLERIDNQMHEELSVPNTSSEKLQGVVTSGKTLKALYWPLAVRSDEKMLVWYDAIISLIQMLYTGALLYKKSTAHYTNNVLPSIEIDVSVESNYALPEDEQEEKQIDLAEVNAMTMSKKAYMKKWRGLTDEEVTEELKQIALEKELLESSSMPKMFPLGNEEQAVEDNSDDKLEEEEIEE